MIRSYKDQAVRRLLEDNRAKPAWRAFQDTARRKLFMLDNARALKDLRSPPGNRLEKLKGGRAGQWSIRINNQWRICFDWSDAPENVEIVDYH